MLRNSDMMVCALQLKQKSTAGICKILEQLLSRIVLGAASENEEEKDAQ